MPQEKYKKIMDENTDDRNLVDTKKIAEYFKVSVEAAASRGKALGYLQ